MHPELLALMEHFELCYKLRDSRPTTWLAPQLLPPTKPAEFNDWTHPDDLVLRYTYDFLPKGIISRLIVRLHRFVPNPDRAWTTGVLFQRDTTQVLAQLLPTARDIELRARGPEKKDLLAVIAADLDALNDSFTGLRGKIDKQIPCCCQKCGPSTEPHFFSEKALRKRKQDNRLRVECPVSYDDIDVLRLLDGIETAKLPSWANKPDQPLPPMTREIRIFLASSAELHPDREAFELHFHRFSNDLRKHGITLEIVLWENFFNAVSKTRLQDEYNKAICSCDLFVSLFFTKAGKYTKEEFNVAHKHFLKNNAPLIWTFFKNANIKTGDAIEKDLKSLWAFQKKVKSIQHLYTPYENTHDLLLQFRDQLTKHLGLAAQSAIAR